MIKTGIYGLLRVLSWLPPLPRTCALVMVAFGVVSGVLGVLYALAQHDLKRLLAYHSVENIGIIGMGIGMGMLGGALGKPALVALGYGGALLHVLNHALFKGLLFLSAGAVIQATGTGEIDRLGGLARKTPVNAAFFLLAAISICGLPPLNGFVGEWIVYGALFEGTRSVPRLSAGVSALGVVSLALMGGLALACFVKVFGVVFLGKERTGTRVARATPGAMRAGMGVLAVLCVAIGVLPGLIVPLTGAGVQVIADLGPMEFERALPSVLAPAGRLSLLAMVFFGLIATLAVVRRGLIQKNAVALPSPVATWGCGYAAATPRMQYTASSFAWSLLSSFRALLCPERRLHAPAAVFSEAAHLESHTVDMAEQDLFAPLFRAASRVSRMIQTLSWTGEPAMERRSARASERLRPFVAVVVGATAAVRRGSIHVYVAFIAFTLLVVFAIEVWVAPGAEGHSAPISVMQGAPQ